MVGRRQVLLEDSRNLPFTNAVVHEIQRVANVGPTTLPHRTSQDVVFQGHFIQKVPAAASSSAPLAGGESWAVFCFQGTMVLPLLASVLFDETQWEQPHAFHPAHFLDQEGKFVKPDAFLPFSAGPSARTRTFSCSRRLEEGLSSPSLLPQVSGPVLVRLWSEWSSSSSWRRSSRTSASRRLLESPQSSFWWPPHQASSACP